MCNVKLHILWCLALPSESHLHLFKGHCRPGNMTPPIHSEMPGSIPLWSISSVVRQKPALTGSAEIFYLFKNKSVPCKLNQTPEVFCSPDHKASKHQLWMWLSAGFHCGLSAVEASLFCSAWLQLCARVLICLALLLPFLFAYDVSFKAFHLHVCCFILTRRKPLFSNMPSQKMAFWQDMCKGTG